MRWAQEGCLRRFDPVSGARITQVTSAAAISNNVYCEQPYCSPDGHRFVFLRKHDYWFEREAGLFVADLRGPRVAQVEEAILGSVCNAAWSGEIFYWRRTRELVRFSLESLRAEVVYREENPKQGLAIHTASSNRRHLLYTEGNRIGRLDIASGRREVLLEDTGLGNPHLQFTPGTGDHILVQQGRENGTTLFVVDADGSNKRYVPAGEPLTMDLTGHECFVAQTGRVLFSSRWMNDPFTDREPGGPPWALDPRFPDGNVFVAEPGAERPVVVSRPEFKFNHLCASKDGRYFVGDAFAGDSFYVDGVIKSAAIVVGCIETRSCRVLVADTLASGGGNQANHTHPYFTADSKHVIFNSNPYYSPAQVFAAQVPEGFLESLG